MINLKESIELLFCRIEEKAKPLQKPLLKIIERLLFYLSILGIILLIYKFGFSKAAYIENVTLAVLEKISIIFFFGLLLRLLLTIQTKLLQKKLLPELSLLLFLSLLLAVRVYKPDWFAVHLPFLLFLKKNICLYLFLLVVFFVEISRKSLSLYSLNLNPARIFIYSFIFVILTGTGLLLLPRATVGGISVIDALFTATSAVCVTGLTAVDTATHFTTLGDFIIICLIQVGGLGIMTFTSFFGFLFKGNFSFNNELFLQSLVNEDKIGEIFKTILKILLITFGIEFLGACCIYLSLPPGFFPDTKSSIGFSLFHSISAFCNAGFSTLPNNLFNSSFRFNYSLQFIIGLLIILGGLGFPIVFNFYRYLKHYFKNKWRQLILRKQYMHAPRIINLNTKLVIATTLVLLFVGMAFYLVFEWNRTLAGLSFGGKLVTAFFGSVTPRTAGFNTVDLTAMAPATVLIYLFLMWVGASPGSTGGGIKTTTFAVAILSMVSIAKGKERIELFKREIAEESVKRALTIIFLSLIFIGLAVLIITVSDPDKSLEAISFECFSAFSTVGLTLGITPHLSYIGKIVIILVMLIGRVGTLTLLVAFVRKAKSAMYRYPKESIFVN